MHERLADLFEGLLTLIVIISGIVLAMMLLAGLSSGSFGMSMLLTLASALFVVLTLGSVSVLVSMRRSLLAIKDELRRRNL